MARPTTPDLLAAPKELKAQLPVSYHLRLHALKVLTGKTISQIVTEALAAHLDRLSPGLAAIEAPRPTRPRADIQA